MTLKTDTPPRSRKNEAAVLSRPPLHVGGYRGQDFITIDTTLPTDRRLVDYSKLPNGRSPAEYARIFSRLPKGLEKALHERGNLEVSITVDEKGRLAPRNGGSKNAPMAIEVSAMIQRQRDGTYSLVGIWGGYAGGGNNGAPAVMSLNKLFSTRKGREALQHYAVLDNTRYDWKNTTHQPAGVSSKNPRAWTYADGSPSTFIPFSCTNTYGVAPQIKLGEHNKRKKFSNTWGCVTGSDESFRARMNARMVVMKNNPNLKHDPANGLGIQTTPSVAAEVFHRNRALAEATLGRVYRLNPLMFETGNRHFHELAARLHKPSAAPSKHPAARKDTHHRLHQRYAAM